MRNLLILIILFNSLLTMAQTREDSLRFGDEAFSDGDYYSASIYYIDILKRDSTNISIAYKYAESCRLFNDYKGAEKWYSFVNASSKSKEYPLALFYLALMNKSNAKYNDARNNFYSYYNLHKSENTYFTKKALHETESCEFAKKLIKDTIPVSIGHLDKNINTPYAEFGAQQLGDTALVYSSLRPNSTNEFEYLLPNYYLAKIYKSKNKIGGWTVGKELNSKINDEKTNNANTYYTKNHKRIYSSRCNLDKVVDMKCAIYVTEFKYGKWQDPVKLNDKINLEGYTSTQPTLHVFPEDSCEALYFVSNRPGGYGGNDIWYSIYKDGKYSDPVNAGNVINTPGDEISPFFDNNSNTFYFSSDWHNGLGGFDIFKSKGGLNEWTKPQNLGYPVNTSYNDLYYTVNENDSDGYFTSNRPGSFFIKGETCCNDIWSYEWLKPKKTKRDSISPIVHVTEDTVNYEQKIIDLLPLTLYFHNDIPDPASKDTFTRFNYKNTVADYLAMKGQYEIEYSEGLTGNAKTQAIKNIDEYFDNYVSTGLSKLEQFSEWLLIELQKGRNIRITVKGYCSPIQTTEYNLRLAKRRISSLKNYFNDYEYGVFVPYINGTSPNKGKLEIFEDAIGKSQSSPLVSDNPHDQRNSIYSRGAALERKIQIIMYQSKDSLKNSKKYPQINFTEEMHNFGNINEGDKKVYSYSFQNTGDADLIVTGVESSCGCIVSDFAKNAILPGARGQINILFDSKDEPGQKVETITVYTNTKTPKKELTVIANVIPAPKK